LLTLTIDDKSFEQKHFWANYWLTSITFTTSKPYHPKNQKQTDVKKSLKIPRGQSEAVSRRTDNTMAKKGQKDKQWSIKHYTKDWDTRIPLQTSSELMWAHFMKKSHTWLVKRLTPWLQNWNLTSHWSIQSYHHTYFCGTTTNNFNSWKCGILKQTVIISIALNNLKI
jgi:hypothetical protein